MGIFLNIFTVDLWERIFFNFLDPIKQAPALISSCFFLNVVSSFSPTFLKHITSPVKNIQGLSTEHLRHFLFYEFKEGKKARDDSELLRKVFGDTLGTYLTVTRWYKRLKSGDLSLNDREREGHPKKCLDDDLQALIDENSCRSERELAEVLEVDRAIISRQLKAMGKIAKAGKWVVRTRTSWNSTGY